MKETVFVYFLYKQKNLAKSAKTQQDEIQEKQASRKQKLEKERNIRAIRNKNMKTKDNKKKKEQKGSKRSKNTWTDFQNTGRKQKEICGKNRFGKGIKVMTIISCIKRKETIQSE